MRKDLISDCHKPWHSLRGFKQLQTRLKLTQDGEPNKRLFHTATFKPETRIKDTKNNHKRLRQEAPAVTGYPLA